MGLYINPRVRYNKPMMKITIVRAYGMDRRGNDVEVGFDILVDGNWGSRFRTLRECKDALALDGITYTPAMRKADTEDSYTQWNNPTASKVA